MKPTYTFSLCACVLLGLATSAAAGAQAVATASRTIQPSAFVMGSGVLTGLEINGKTSWVGGKNLAVTAGIDLGVYPIGRYLLGIEVRGTFPVHSGTIVGETNVLGGVRMTRETEGNGRLRPYIDVLYGRGQMDYQDGGYLLPGLLYTQTAGGVFAGGAGVEYDVTQHFSAKLDGQIEQWSTPVTTTGSVHSTQIGVGVVYRFGAGEGPR